jgi:hypothetical protein
MLKEWFFYWMKDNNVVRRWTFSINSELNACIWWAVYFGSKLFAKSNDINAKLTFAQ